MFYYICVPGFCWTHTLGARHSYYYPIFVYAMFYLISIYIHEDDKIQFFKIVSGDPIWIPGVPTRGWKTLSYMVSQVIPSLGQHGNAAIADK